MPFGAHDPQGDILRQYLAESIRVVVVLAGDQEIMACTGRDLRLEYKRQGMAVIHLPISDFSTPSLEALDCAILSALQAARSGKNLAVHCQAGLGRTGLFLACLAQRILGLSPTESILWVRDHIPGAIETLEQSRFVMDYGDYLC